MNSLKQLAAIWSRLEAGQRITLVLVGIGFVVAAGVLSWGASQPDYRLLARDLRPGQVAEIAGHLESSHVPYRVTDSETAIMVPAKDLYRLRNDLAERSMLGDGAKGFEILAQNRMWDTTFNEHKTYDRAVAGELERSFRELPGVRGARVIIDRPSPSPFVGDESGRPKASIKLDMASSMRLSERQIAGIIHLTSGAVANLTPDHVQVMDSSGLLTPATDDRGAGAANTALDAEIAREMHLTRKAQELLDATLGPGRSKVKVSVKLDFTRRTAESTDPTKSVALRENTTTTDEKTPVFSNQGVAGTASNVEGERPAATGAPVVSTKTSEKTENQYVVGNRKVVQEDEVGRILGMSVSILLDQKVSQVAKLDDKGQPTKEMTEKREDYSEAEKRRFQELVLGAIGFNAAKGIQATENAATAESRFSVAVQSMELYREPATVVAASAGPLPQQWLDYGGYALAAVVALVLLVVARGQLKRSHLAFQQAETRARAAADAGRPAGRRDGGSGDDAVARRQELKERIRRSVQEDPTAAASVLRKWLGEA